MCSQELPPDYLNNQTIQQQSVSNHKTIAMKKLLITLTFLPFAAMAQDVAQADDVTPTFYKNEIGIGTGVHLNIIDDDLYPGSLGTRVSLGYLRNIDRVQIGLVAEAGSEDGLYRYISPVLMFNYRIPVGKSYGYIGMAGGYYQQQYTSYGWLVETKYAFSYQNCALRNDSSDVKEKCLLKFHT